MILFDGNKIKPSEFPDKTPCFQSVPVTKGVHYRIRWYYESMDELITLIMLAAHIYDNGAYSTLYMPYVPNARMDRVHSPHEIFTLRHFCNTINSLSFQGVHILDPHSYVTPALIDRVVVHSAEPYINHALSLVIEKHRSRPFIVYPDDGAAKRYSLDVCDAVYGVKKRDWDTGRIEGLMLNGRIPTNRPALIVDDICSYGGTFARTAKELKKAGVEHIYLYITHCEKHIYDGELIRDHLVDGVFTTNSIMLDGGNDITVFPLKEGFDIV